MAEDPKKSEDPKKDKERTRSPGYPTIDLEAAIIKAKTLYSEDKGVAVAPEVIAQHWKSKTNSSTFMQDFASLKRFGLLVEAGPGKWKVSREAIDIFLLSPEDPVSLQRIRDAALTPKIHAALWTEFRISKLPSDTTLVHKLVTEKGFQENSARDLIKQYRKTLAFAKLSDDDKLPNDVSEKEDPLPTPAAAWAKIFTPGEKKSEMQTTMKQDTFSLEEGQVVLQWPSRLSKPSYDDLKDWMELQLRKIKRGVQDDPQAKTLDDEAN